MLNTHLSSSILSTSSKVRYKYLSVSARKKLQQADQNNHRGVNGNRWVPRHFVHLVRSVGVNVVHTGIPNVGACILFDGAENLIGSVPPFDVVRNPPHVKQALHGLKQRLTAARSHEIK